MLKYKIEEKKYVMLRAKYRMALILTLIQLFLAVGWANGFYKKNEVSFMFLLICRKYEGE